VTPPVHRLERRQRLERPIDEVFPFFARAHNLEEITPSWLRFRVRDPEPTRMGEGALIHYDLRLHGLPLRWTSRIEEWDPGRSFVDRQLRGPYRLWHHRHTFRSDGAGTVIGDEVHYVLPFGPLGELAHSLFVRRDLERIFDYRHAAVARLLAS
jgi:ligand-binding SRPBCC domain-containing protein